MNSEIKKYFQVTVGNAIPLYKQVISGFENFIADHLPGSRVPSENALASFFSINRETVRKAVLKFVEEGKLVRNRKGTFIAGIKEIPSFVQPHPLVFQGTMPPEKTSTIKLLLYENLPNQKKFWDETVSAFNESLKHAQIVIDWVPDEVRNIERYSNYIRNTEPDIFQMSELSEPFFLNNNLLTELPEALLEKLDSSDYWRFASKNSIPLHFSGWGIFWNDALCEKYRLKHVRKKILSGQFLELLHEAQAAVKDDGIHASGMIWNYLCSLGFPEKDGFDHEAFFRNRFEHIKDTGDIFMIDEQYPMEGLDSFREGKSIFYITANWFVSSYIESFNFPLNAVWNISEDGFFCSSPPSSIGIFKSKDSKKQDIIVMFINYLLSAEPQKLIAKYGLNCAVLKEANKSFMEEKHCTDFERLKQSCDKLTASQFTSRLNSFYVYNIRDLYVKLIKGQINCADAALEAVKRWKV